MEKEIPEVARPQSRHPRSTPPAQAPQPGARRVGGQGCFFPAQPRSPWTSQKGAPLLLAGPSLLAAIQNLSLAACLGKRERKRRKRKEEETGGNQKQERMHSVCGLVRRGGRGGAPHSPTGATNAILPPTHHSPLGGQSLAKLSTKIKLRCRFLPIALNRADWIRIFLFSSHLDHLGDWGPEGRLGPGGGGTETAQQFSAAEPGSSEPSHPLSQDQVYSLPVQDVLCSATGQVPVGLPSPLSIPCKPQAVHGP